MGFKLDIAKIFIILAIGITINFSTISANSNTEIISDIEPQDSNESNTVLEAESQLEIITNEETEVLESLYIMEQELIAFGKQEDNLNDEIESKENEIEAIEEEMQALSNQFDANKENLRVILISYQRIGTTSFVEMLLEASSLSELISRIGMIRDLARDTDELMVAIDDNKLQLSAYKERVVQAIEEIEKEKEELQALIEVKRALKNQKELYLSSLVDEREQYEGYLNEIEEDWTELKVIFKEASYNFSRLATEGILSPDDISLNFSLSGVKGKILEETFNKVIADNEALPDLHFEFHEDASTVVIEKHNLELVGNFVVIDGSMLRFMPDEGSFYDMELTDATISELFEEGYLEMNIKPLLGGNLVDEVNTYEGYMELLVKFNLFGRNGG